MLEYGDEISIIIEPPTEEYKSTRIGRQKKRKKIIAEKKQKEKQKA